MKANRLKRVGAISMRPDCTSARSSSSVIRLASSAAASLMNFTCFSCSAFSWPSTPLASSLEMFSMMLIGVRNSWVMLEKKRLFDSPASFNS